MLGAVECSAFQAGTRAIVSSLIQAHDEAGKVVLVNGGTTAKWARLFGDVGNDEEEEAHVSLPRSGFCHGLCKH